MPAITESGKEPALNTGGAADGNIELMKGKREHDEVKPQLAFSFAGMKPGGIIEVYRNRIKKISRHCRNLPEHFDANVIHHFRVEMKKLRAFLRLVSMASAHPQKISGEIKSFYSITGNIRNLQLYQKRIVALCNELSLAVPDAYLQSLAHQEKELVKQAQSMIKDVEMEDLEKKLVDKVPDELSKEHCSGFVQKSKIRLQQLSMLHPADQTLHDVRKLLKDLLYNYRYLKPAVPYGFKAMEAITHELGEYHDLCVSLDFLRSADMHQTKDSDVLNELKSQLQFHKEKAEQQLARQLRTDVFSKLENV